MALSRTNTLAYCSGSFASKTNLLNLGQISYTVWWQRMKSCMTLTMRHQCLNLQSNKLHCLALSRTNTLAYWSGSLTLKGKKCLITQTYEIYVIKCYISVTEYQANTLQPLALSRRNTPAYWCRSLVTKDEKLYCTDNETSVSESSIKLATLFGLVRDKHSSLLFWTVGNESKKFLCYFDKRYQCHQSLPICYWISDK